MNKVWLDDVSILIPVRIDCSERYQNLLLVLKYILLNFETKVIILEADGEPRIRVATLPKGVEYYFVRDNSKKFHRTRYINQLIRYSKTEYVGIYDTDVVFPISQIKEAVELLRQGSCSYVSPYSGSFVMLGEEAKTDFIQNFDVTVFERYVSGRIGTRRSWGGAFFVNKADFISAGMCNEYLTSWGPDDVEQKKRMEILGYGVKRIDGYLFHFHHPRGLNSTYVSIEERIVLMNEYMSIVSMTREKLKRYVCSWPWRKEETLMCGENVLERLSVQTAELLKKCDEGDKLLSGRAGLALIYFTLSKAMDNEQSRTKAIGLLKDILDKAVLDESLNLVNGFGAVAWVVALINDRQLLTDFLSVLQHTDSRLQSLSANGKAENISLNNGSLARAWYLVCRIESYCRSYGSFDKVFYEETLVQVLDDINEQLDEVQNIFDLAGVYILFYHLSNFCINQEVVNSRLKWFAIYTENYFKDEKELIDRNELRLLYAYSYVSCKTENREMTSLAGKYFLLYKDRFPLTDLNCEDRGIFYRWYLLFDELPQDFPELKLETIAAVMTGLQDSCHLSLGRYGWLLTL